MPQYAQNNPVRRNWFLYATNPIKLGLSGDWEAIIGVFGLRPAAPKSVLRNSLGIICGVYCLANNKAIYAL